MNRTYIGQLAAGALTLTFLAGTAYAGWTQAAPGYRASAGAAIPMMAAGVSVGAAETPAPAIPNAPWNDPDRWAFMNRMMGGNVPVITPELAEQMGAIHAQMHGGDPQEAAQAMLQYCGGQADAGSPADAGSAGTTSGVSIQ
ncbi:MAG: hypothetical protein ACM3ZA_08185 [Bacillota bacterium]